MALSLSEASNAQKTKSRSGGATKSKKSGIVANFEKWDKDVDGGRKLANWLKLNHSSLTKDDMSKIEKYLLSKQNDKHSIEEFCAAQGLTRLATISVTHVCIVSYAVSLSLCVSLFGMSDSVCLIAKNTKNYDKYVSWIIRRCYFMFWDVC